MLGLIIGPDGIKMDPKKDASEFATGAVLSMLQDDGKWHPCAYLSKEFNDTECNYDVHDKEMMGIMHALEAW